MPGSQHELTSSSAKFSTGAGAPDSYTQSPPPKHATLKRSGTVADRISEKLRLASAHSRSSSVDAASLRSPPSEPLSPTKQSSKPQPPRLQTITQGAAQQNNGAADSPSSPTQEDAFIPPEDPHGLPTMDAPPVPGKDGLLPPKNAPEQVVLFSGISLSAQAFKDLLTRFDQYLETHAALGFPLQGELNTRAVLASRERNTIIGVYQKTFSGIEVVEWLRKNVEAFGSEWDRCIDAATELHRTGHLSRIGVGRGFEPSDDTFYVLKVIPSEAMSLSTLQNSFKEMNIGSHISSPISANTTSHYTSMLRSYIPASLGPSDEPMYIRLRRDANRANEAYHASVASSEESRLDMEQRIERGLRIWEKWERERLSVVRTVLKHYEETLAKLPKRIADLQEGTALAVEAFNPDADLKALIEGSRTGPFRPRPHIFESVESEVPSVNFGIDLRRWAGDTAWRALVTQPQRPKDAIPDVLAALLQASTEMDADIATEERRKSWLYEVPLSETHQLRKVINDPHMTIEAIVEAAKKFNPPIVAGTVKLWYLELNPPVLGWEGWEDAKAIYPSIGADQERDMTSAVTSVIERLPACQLFSLNALIKHFKDLIASTKSETEDDNVYVTKLSLSTGRCLLRPQYETELTIQDRTPGLFLADLIEHYDQVFPALLEKKKVQVDRPMPHRKRTALVDQRISRSRLDQSGASLNPQELLTEQVRATAPRPESIPQAPPAIHTGVTLTDGPAPAGVTLSDGPPKFVSPPQSPTESTPRAASPISPAKAPVDDGAADSDDDEPAFEPPSETPSATLPALAAAAAGGDEALTTAAGLKRSGSQETSRLRGPRGARGPRPSASHVKSGSVSKMAQQFEGK